MRSIVARIVILTIPLLLPGQVLPGQELATIAGTPSCPRCTIVRIPVATLGARTDAVLLGPRSVIARDSRGRFYASSATRSGPQVAVFDSTGRQVGSFGPRGQGPGELEGITTLRIGAGDTLYVSFQHIVDVFAPVGRFVRRITFRGAIRALSDIMPLSDGRLLISARPIGPDSSLLFQIVDSRGTLIMGLGSNDPRCVRCSGRSLGRGRSGDSFLAVRSLAYEIEEWDIAGQRLLKRLTITPPWFNATQNAQSLVGRAPPPSGMGWVAWDTASLVWVAASTAASDFKPYTGNAPLFRGAIIRESQTGNFVTERGWEQDTAFANHVRRSRAMVIELVDFARNTVIASAKTDAEQFGLMDGGLGHDRVEDADGFVRIRVWRFELRGS